MAEGKILLDTSGVHAHLYDDYTTEFDDDFELPDSRNRVTLTGGATGDGLMVTYEDLPEEMSRDDGLTGG